MSEFFQLEMNICEELFYCTGYLKIWQYRNGKCNLKKKQIHKSTNKKI